MIDPLSGQIVSGMYPAGDSGVPEPDRLTLEELMKQLTMAPAPQPPQIPKMNILSQILGPIGDALMARASVKAGGTPQPGMYAQSMGERRRHIGELQSDYQRRLEDTEAANRNLLNTIRVSDYGARIKARDTSELQASRNEAAQERAELQHKVRMQELDIAAMRANTAEDMAEIAKQRADDTARYNEEIIGLRGSGGGGAAPKMGEDTSGNQAFIYPPDNSNPSGRIVTLRDASGKAIVGKAAAMYADTGARINMAQKQLNIMRKHYDDAISRGRGPTGMIGGALARGEKTSWLAGYMGQGGKDAQLHETYRDSLAVTLAPLLSGSKRAVQGIMVAIKPTMPSFVDEPTVASEKYANMDRLLAIAGSLPGATPIQRAQARAALREKVLSFVTDPNQAANVQKAFSESDAQPDSEPIADYANEPAEEPVANEIPAGTRRTTSTGKTAEMGEDGQWHLVVE